MYRKSLEIPKIFKNYTLKTYLLDDFMYYENRQKVMQEEKAKFLSKNFRSQSLVPVLEPLLIVPMPPVMHLWIKRLRPVKLIAKIFLLY